VNPIVFDTTCVSHFARAGRLEVLDLVTRGWDRVIPNEVATELQRGVADHPALSTVFAQPWLTIIELEFPEVVYAATFKGELGGSPEEHLGECAVLGWVKHHGGLAIVDDSAACATAEHHKIPVRGTLSLVVLGYKAGALDRDAVEGLVDELASTDMRLPVDGAGFFGWAYTEGLLP
jgi:predicted nucleic acid-binding protein